MKPTERSVQKPSATTGLFATLRALLHGRGSGAPGAALAVALVLAGLLAFTATPALATPPTTICPSGSGAGQCNQPSSVAVDQLSGTVYVADANRRVDEFEANGTFIRAFGYGVVNGANELQACTTATGCQAGLSGLFPTALAVDNSTNPLDLSKGDVYVSNGSSSSVDKFSPAGTLLLTFGSAGTGPGQFSPAVRNESAALPAAVDMSGNVWVGDRNRIEQFTPEGAFKSEVKLPGVALLKTLAIDTDPSSSSSGDFYASDQSQNESQEIIPPASGSYTLSFEGQTTAALSFNATAAEIDVALEALSTIGAGNVSVFLEGNIGREKNFTVNFVGALGDRVLPLMTASAGTVAMREEGASGHLLKLKPDGTTIETLDEGGNPNAIGLDPATGDLFVSDSSGQVGSSATLLEYAPSGVHIESFGAGEIPSTYGGPKGNALAFGDAANALYVVSNEAAQIFTLPAAGPLLQQGSLFAKPLKTTTATLNATLNPEGAETKYHFQYVSDQHFKAEGFNNPTEGAVASVSGDFAEHPVSNAITGLGAETTYHFRVLAENTNGKGNTETEEATFTTLPPVVISEQFVSDVTATSATVGAQINPLGNISEYRVEYLTEAAYQHDVEVGEEPFTGCGTPANPGCLITPEAGLAPVEEPVHVSQHIQGLEPHTAYRYRILAHNGGGAAKGPVQAFLTQSVGGSTGSAASGLPDGRQYELVSPPDKHGANIIQVFPETNFAIQAASGGGAFTYLTTAPTESEPAGNSNFTQVLSTRTSTGWSSRDLNTPHSEPIGFLLNAQEYRVFSADLSLGLLQPFGAFEPALSALASEQTPYLRNDSGGGYQPLIAAANVPEGTAFGVAQFNGGACPPEQQRGPLFQGATSDLGHVVLKSRVPLAEGAPAQGLYEWSAGKPVSEPPRLVSVPPAGESVSGSPLLGAPREFASGVDVRHAISADGSRVVWSTNARARLYMWDAVSGESVRLDAVQGGSAKGTPEPEFQTASSDGSKVFFIDTQRLTEHSGASARKPDLYECEITEVEEGKLHCKLTDLTPEASGESGDVLVSQGVVPARIPGASDDGSYVYFAANGVLAAGAVPGTCGTSSPEEAQTCNLYLHHEGSTKLVALLSGADTPDWGGGGGLPGLTARVSPNGRWLAFMSARSLTGYDNHDATSGKPDEEVFLYHAAANEGAGQLVCASCNPTGGRPHGVLIENQPLVGSVWDNHWLAASVPGWTSELYQSRYLSDSGRLFFDSSDALVPQDKNNTQDVYQYEPPGGAEGVPASDTCTTASPTYRPASGGCIDLISSGASPEESVFFDASESGDEVFFLTAAELSSQDVDTALDVYNAHACSASSPCPPPPPPGPPACVGDACQSPGEAPNDPTPGSLSFHGPTNSAPTPPTTVKKTTKKTVKCKKPKKLTHGKCVKSKKKAKRASNNRRAK